jgi:hypothetical protein
LQAGVGVGEGAGAPGDLALELGVGLLQQRLGLELLAQDAPALGHHQQGSSTQPVATAARAPWPMAWARIGCRSEKIKRRQPVLLSWRPWTR